MGKFNAFFSLFFFLFPEREGGKEWWGGLVRERRRAFPCLPPRSSLPGAGGPSGCSAGGGRGGRSTRHALPGRVKLPAALGFTRCKNASFSTPERGPLCLPRLNTAPHPATTVLLLRLMLKSSWLRKPQGAGDEEPRGERGKVLAVMIYGGR